jgi:hypothetical protein
VASVEAFVTVSAGLRHDPARWQRCLDQTRRRLLARIPSGRRAETQLTFAIVEYPTEPTPPGHHVYRFVLTHRASRPSDAGSKLPVRARVLPTSAA